MSGTSEPGLVTDMVNHPPHYQSNSGLEAIEVIEAFFLDNALLANAFKYLARAGKKGSAGEDLRKSVWYINREIERLGGQPVAEAAGFKVGDRVRVKNAHGHFSCGLAPGETGRIVDGPGSDGDYKVDPDGDAEWKYVHGRYLESAPWMVGDYVRENIMGRVGRISQDIDGDGECYVDFDGWSAYMDADELEPAGDFRKGDMVKVIGGSYSHAYPIGSTVMVEGVADDGAIECVDDNGLDQTLAPGSLTYTL